MFTRLTGLFSKRNADRDAAEELATHVQFHIDDNLRAGMTPDEARRRAFIALGGAEPTRERLRDRQSFLWVENTLRDCQYALRGFRRAPLFTLAVVSTLALGIGANTGIFSVINSLSFRKLPVFEPEHLALLAIPTNRSGSTTLVANANELNATFTNPIWEQIRQLDGVFDGAFAWSPAEFDVADHGEAEFVQGLWASAQLFKALGVRPMIGRTFEDADDRRGAGPSGPVAVISYAFWQRRFGGSRDAVGRTLTIERVPFTIVGITPPDFFGPDVGRSYDVAIPIGTDPLVRGVRESRLDGRDWWWLKIMVRLKPNQSLDQGARLLRIAQTQIRDATLPDWPADFLAQYLTRDLALVPAATGESSLRRIYRDPLVVLLALVALVLAVACTNLTNLLLARAAARRQELSVRVCLGASRWRLASAFLIEHAMLAAMGGVLGLVIARGVSAWLVRGISSSTEPVFLNLAVDWRILLYTGVVAVATMVHLAIAPLLSTVRIAPFDAVRGHGRMTDSGSSRSAWFGSARVVVQVALSLVLVVAAALLVRTFSALASVHLGFDRDRVLLLTINTQKTGMPVEERLAAYERVRQRVLNVPGVSSAGIAHQDLLSGGATGTRVQLDGAGETRQALFLEVTPAWLAALGQTVRAGRDITESDGANAAPIALVNEAFARSFLGGSNPLGHAVRYSMSDAPTDRDIVGVVSDAVYRNLREPVPPTIYVPLAQYDASSDRLPPPVVNMSVRALGGSPASLTRSLAAAVGDVMPSASLTFRTLSDKVDNSLRQERVIAATAGLFAGVALVLAGIGLYGVVAYGITRRRVEFGIRMALGATRGDVMQLAVLRVLRSVGIGMTIGLAVSLGVSQWIASLLYGVGPRDLGTVGAAVSILAVAALLAAASAAWRSLRFDPLRALRAE